jgi:hypothetical protein
LVARLTGWQNFGAESQDTIVGQSSTALVREESAKMAQTNGVFLLVAANSAFFYLGWAPEIPRNR